MGDFVCGICKQASFSKKSPGGVLLHQSVAWWVECLIVSKVFLKRSSIHTLSWELVEGPLAVIAAFLSSKLCTSGFGVILPVLNIHNCPWPTSVLPSICIWIIVSLTGRPLELAGSENTSLINHPQLSENMQLAFSFLSASLEMLYSHTLAVL